MTRRTEEPGSSYDVVVIGGGAAGLSGALMLARSRRSVLVVDAGQPRNAPAEGVHGLLGHDGTAPARLLARGREEVRRYGGEVADGEVTGARREADGFAVTLADGRLLRARRLLVATGLVDVLPDVPGLRERWGRDVLHCPYCHGWEVRDRAIGVLAVGPMSVHQALLFRQLSADVVYLAHGTDLPAEQAGQLAARGIRVVDGRVASVESDGDRLAGVRLEDGRLIPREAVVVATRMVARAGFLTDLGLVAEQHASGMGEHLVRDPETGRTSVPGVWVAGNVADLAAQVGGAAAAGAMAGAQINADLVMEETRLAVEASAPAPTRGASHGAHHGDGHDSPEAFWEDFYRDADPWSGRPNALLVSELTDRPIGDPPGAALDLGCGTGGDAIWLAQQGWTVTGVDVSRAALDRAGRAAECAGVSDRVRWERVDLETEELHGTWDLVTAAYLHSPVELHRERVLRRAAAAVAPGGTLLVIGHQGAPTWATEPMRVSPPPVEEVLAALDLDGWVVERAEAVELPSPAPDGGPGTRLDNVLRLRRAA